MNTLLSSHRLAYGHPGRTLGRDITLDLHAGEVLCVLGPNGGGKTTLFRTLLGLIPMHAGEIMLAGKKLGACTAAERARHMAYVPQAGSSYFAFTVREMVLMGRTAHLGLLSAPGQKDFTATEAAMDELRIAHLADRPFTHISGGERQLTLIARALAQASPLLIMDEPTASLDFGNQALILEEIVRLKSNGRSVMFCTHDPDHALQCADRVLLLHQGNALAMGGPRQTITAENLKTIYGVEVRMLEDAATGLTRYLPMLRQ